jgi:hypothetical protein
VAHFDKAFNEAGLRIIVHLVETEVARPACLLDDLLRVGRYRDEFDF